MGNYTYVIELLHCKALISNASNLVICEYLKIMGIILMAHSLLMMPYVSNVRIGANGASVIDNNFE